MAQIHEQELELFVKRKPTFADRLAWALTWAAWNWVRNISSWMRNWRTWNAWASRNQNEQEAKDRK